MRTAALKAASRNVHVNCINPGPIVSRMMARIDAESGRKETTDAAAFVPARRYGMPEEVAGWVAFLGSSTSSHSTGGLYTVDGALSAA